MKLKHILLILLLILLVIATGATLLGEFKEMVTEPKGNASIVVTGDVMFARNMPAVLDFDSSPFRGVTDVVSAADLLLINFENAATSSEDAVKGDVPLKCDPSYVPLAKANNNTVAALANNHACDYGISGMRDTISNLKNAGITPMGAGETEADAHKAYTEVINGRKITVLNYMDSNDFSEYSYEVMPYANGSSPGYSAYSSQDAQKQISEHNDSDLIVAYLHFGNEYSHSPNEDQVKMAHELIDYGADVVIGSHPHVTQGIEMYKDRPIFYSLGNFIFDQSNEDTHTAYFVQLNLVNDTCNCNVYPIHISNYLPIHMGTEDGYNLLSGLTPNCEELDITNGVGRLNFTLSDK